MSEIRVHFFEGRPYFAAGEVQAEMNRLAAIIRKLEDCECGKAHEKHCRHYKPDEKAQSNE